MASVKQLWPVRKISLPNTGVIQKPTNQNAAATIINKRQETNGNGLFSSHVMTQVDRLHAEGVTGKGIKIGVIDTGIDYKVSNPEVEWIDFP